MIFTVLLTGREKTQVSMKNCLKSLWKKLTFFTQVINLTLTRTHSLTLSLTRTHSLSLPLTVTHTYSLSLSLTHAFFHPNASSVWRILPYFNFTTPRVHQKYGKRCNDKTFKKETGFKLVSRSMDFQIISSNLMHSTEVAYLLLTQQPQIRFSA